LRRAGLKPAHFFQNSISLGFKVGLKPAAFLQQFAGGICLVPEHPHFATKAQKLPKLLARQRWRWSGSLHAIGKRLIVRGEAGDLLAQGQIFLARSALGLLLNGHRDGKAANDDGAETDLQFRHAHNFYQG